MNCRDIEPLLLVERDGVLTNEQRAALSMHVATCPACRQLQNRLTAALNSLKADANAITAPDADEAWRDLQAKLRETERKTSRKRPLAPVIWFSAPLAAAAAIAVVFFTTRPATSTPSGELPITPPLYDPSTIAGADFVEAGDPNASTMVYVDKESGWLVVWATDGDNTSKG